MFYATLALLVTVNKESSKHIGVISFFDSEFVKKNIFPKEMSRMLHQAFVLKDAEEFLKAVEEKLL
jgi:uncharacterized protein (UPF0332 family)